MKKINFIIAMLLAAIFGKAQTFPVTFEAPKLSKPDTFWNGSDGSGGFKSNGITFRNVYDTTYKVWSGFGISNMKDSVTPGYGNQYSAFTNGGFQMTSQYGVVSGNAWMVFDTPSRISGMYVTNSTYTALDMKNGSAFSKKFGGASGNDQDYFILKAYGYSGGKRTDSAKVILADFRGLKENDHILNRWEWLYMDNWKKVDSIYFDYESSDVSSFGINTPLFFCVDDVNGIRPHSFSYVADFEKFDLGARGYWNGDYSETGFVSGNMIFENEYNKDWNSWTGWAVSNHTDTTTIGFSNQYSAVTGKGIGGSSMDQNYLVGNYHSVIRANVFGYVASYFYITNSTYTYHAMKEGDAFSKKFGGASGNDPDWLKLTILGYDESGKFVDSVVTYLADYRFNNNVEDYIVKDWRQVKITDMVRRSVVRLEFSLSSSDNGPFGMNTPAYFCLDLFVNATESVEQISNSKFAIYPNPTSDFISFKNIEGNGQIQILSLDGRMVLERHFSKGDQIYVGDFSPGMYIVRVEQDHQIMQTKFIKQ